MPPPPPASSCSVEEVESYNAAVTMLANYSVFYVIENHPHSQGDKWDMTSSQASTVQEYLFFA